MPTLNKVSSNLPMSVSGCITSFPLIVYMWAQPYFTEQHHVMKVGKTTQKTLNLFFHSHKFLPLALGLSQQAHRTLSSPSKDRLELTQP